MKYTVGIISALLCTALLSTPLCAQNLIKDGSFEQQTVANSGFDTYHSATTVGGWNVQNIDHISDYWVAQDGNQSIDLNAESEGNIWQIINTTAGKDYQLSFYMAGNNGLGDGVKTMDVSIDNNVLASPTFDTTGHGYSDMGWKLYTYDFTATGSSTKVSFQSTFPSACGAALDNVSVQALPIPEASTMLLLGCLFVPGMLLMRRRQALSL